MSKIAAFGRFLHLPTVLIGAFMIAGCAVEAAKVAPAAPQSAAPTSATSNSGESTVKSSKAPSIEIEQDSPADTVRVFYNSLRANKLREAMFLTNLRPAIEGLTNDELSDLQLDLAPLAAQIPDDLKINGEIISGNYATVTAHLPDNETKELKLQQLRLRKEGNFWVLLTVDEAAEPAIKREGRDYFFKLRLQTHESDAKAMLERVAKAQMVYSLQNAGKFTDLGGLVAAGLLPEDAMTADSTGYNYVISVAADALNYVATAEPKTYGKTGKLSFLLQLDENKKPKLAAADKQGS